MTDESQLLLYAVLDNPGEDAPRSALADWLQENGETPFHRWYGEFIAAQLRREPWGDRNLWSDSLVGPVAKYLNVYGVQLRPHWDDATSPITYWRGVDPTLKSRLDSPLFEFHRGFCRRVSLTMDEFLRLVIVLFKRHPIEDVAIRNFGWSYFGATRYSGQVWRININNLPSTQSGRGGADYHLPVAFGGILDGGEEVANGYGDREYPTEADALAALSRACVAFGRKLARDARSLSSPNVL